MFIFRRSLQTEKDIKPLKKDGGIAAEAAIEDGVVLIAVVLPGPSATAALAWNTREAPGVYLNLKLDEAFFCFCSSMSQLTYFLNKV